MNGIERIVAERQRQIEEEGWTAEHDDTHTSEQLAMAAACYAAPEKIYVRLEFAGGVDFHDPWPWAGIWDKRAGCGDTRKGEKNEGANFPPDPGEYLDNERLDLLTKAGALIAAEIDRLTRAQAKDGDDEESTQ